MRMRHCAQLWTRFGRDIEKILAKFLTVARVPSCGHPTTFPLVKGTTQHLTTVGISG